MVYLSKKIDNEPPEGKKHSSSGWRKVMLLCAFLLASMAGWHLVNRLSNGSKNTEHERVESSADLPEERLAKLNRELAKYQSADQYALIAISPGWYPCYSCINSGQILLNAGEIWKYGVTINGKSRYPASFYADFKLSYIVQFTGDLQSCLEEEKRKIYFYAILPENLKRPVPLIRPPGNKNDS